MKESKVPVGIRTHRGEGQVVGKTSNMVMSSPFKRLGDTPIGKCLLQK
jgi:hypothetical protein